MKKIQDTDKIFRLFTPVCIILFSFCLYSLFNENQIDRSGEMEKFDEYLFFMGLYFGNAVPRVAFYTLCYLYVKFKYNGICQGKDEDFEISKILGPGLLFGSGMSVGAYIPSYTPCFIIGFFGEYLIAKSFFTFKKESSS